jgi:long-subunit fatty acid transport protein
MELKAARFFSMVKQILLLLAYALLFFPVTHSSAQQLFSDVQINASPNPIGSGARAQGMGGAFIAVADDATAASWNPGGLIQLERPEFSIVGSYTYRKRDFTSSSHPEADSSNSIGRYDLNYLSCVYPFRALDKNMVVSLNYQQLYDFYNKLDFNYDFKGRYSDSSFFKVQTTTRFRQSGALKALAPAFAVQITPRFSIGLTVNFWTDNLGYDNGWTWERKVTGSSSIHTATRLLARYHHESITREENKNFEGVNANIGFLWQINRVVTIGAVLKTPFEASAERTTYTENYTEPLGQNSSVRTQRRGVSKKQSIDIKMPMSYGMGIAFRLADALTIDFDVYRTEWSKFYVRAGGEKTNIAGDPWKQSHPGDTTQVRTGCEYLFILEKTIIPARFGLFFDPEPATGHPKDYYGITLGTGIMLGKVVLDCCYVYRHAHGVEAEVPNVTRNDNQHSVLTSMIVHF